MKRTTLLVLILAALAAAGGKLPDSLRVKPTAPDHSKALAQFRADSTRAELTLQAAQIRARTIMEEAYLRLQRDTTTAGR